MEFQSLEITVFADYVTYRSDEMFPVMGEHRQYSDITYGKQGGSRDSQNKFGVEKPLHWFKVVGP